MREDGAAGDVFGAFEAALSDELEGGAAGCGRVVEAGLEGDVAVVYAVGVELDTGAAGRAAEEVDEATFADHVDGPLPRGGDGYGFDDDVGAAVLGGEGAGGGDYIVYGFDVDDAGCAEELCGGDLVFALDDGDDVDAGDLGDVHEHEADGAGADDDHGVAGLGSAFLEAADDAGEGLGEGGVFEGDVVGDEEGVLFDDAGGDADVFGVGAVVEEEILAEILLAMVQKKQTSQGAELRATMRSPSRKAVTPGPTSVTTPASSWPKGMGGCSMRAW